MIKFYRIQSKDEVNIKKSKEESFKDGKEKRTIIN